MKKITQEKFNSFKRDEDGILHLPTADYSLIKKFPELCFFSEGCFFGEECSFIRWCSFGKDCSFIRRCSFSEDCSFSRGCFFSEGCSFGRRCSFSEDCSFIWRCSFSEDCSFIRRCSFSEDCSFSRGCFFGEECRYCKFVFDKFTLLSGVYKYPIRIYQNKDKYMLSIGCFNFSSLKEAVAYAKKSNCYCKLTHRILKLYLGE